MLQQNRRLITGHRWIWTSHR